MRKSSTLGSSDLIADQLRSCRKGTIITLGNASGPVPPFAPLKLAPKNLKGQSASSWQSLLLAVVQPRLSCPAAVMADSLSHFTVCRPVLNQYVHTREEFQTYSTELFKLVKDGHLTLAVHAEYPFTADGVKQAQKDISELSAFATCAAPGDCVGEALWRMLDRVDEMLTLSFALPLAASRKTSGKLLIKVA